MERWITKLIVLVLLFIIPMVASFIPLKIYSIFENKGKRGREVLGWLMCFGGGVFFATYILHMVPDVQEILKEALIDPYDIDYPLAEVLMAAGFFLVLTVEILVMDHNKRSEKKKRNDVVLYQIKENITSDIRGMENVSVDNPGTICDTVTYDQGSNDHHISRSFILMVALSLHHLFEGLAVGLKDNERDIWNMFIAVICHEIVISFSLGLQLVKNKFSTNKFIIYAGSCSLILPLGIGVAILLSELESNNSGLDIVNGVMQAIATGSFIYVTFFEILAEEINHMSATKLRLFFLILGFVAMAALGTIPEEHSHLSESHHSQHTHDHEENYKNFTLIDA